MKGWFNRDEEGKVIVDTDGHVTITCEEENVVFQIHMSEIDEKAEQMCFNVNGKDIFIDVVQWEPPELDSECEKPVDEVKFKDKDKEDREDREDGDDKEDREEREDDREDDKEDREDREEDRANAPATSKCGNAIFPWCDASTKIFLREYKMKKELVKNRKLKNMKRAYQEIAKNLGENGFHVSSLQVENRYKTLKRAYKNMMLYNRRNGRGKYICSYEQDLDEIFSSDIYDTELNGDDDLKATSTANKNNATTDIDAAHLKTIQHNAKLEAQNVKIIENLQSCQRLLRNLITRMDNKSKNSNYMRNGVLQVCMEMRDMQKEAIARAEEQRDKANEQREMRNTLLEEIVTILKSRKDT